MEFDQILTELKSKKYRPVYFLMGEEPFFIDEITNYIANNVLTETEKVFNQVMLYGKDVDAIAVIDASRRFPMMASHQVVIVKEAQNIRNIEELIHYTQKPLNSTILVISYKYKSLDKRKKLYGTIEKNGGAVLHSDKLYDDKIPSWITKYLTQKGYSIAPEAGALLTEYLGNDLGKVVNELTKLLLTIPSNVKRITVDMIEKNIGISKEFNTFELQKALVARDVLKANRIIDYFDKNPKDNPIIVTISLLFTFFSKIFTYHFLKDKSKGSVASALKVNPYFVSEYELAAKRYNPAKLVEIIALLREFDLKSKGVGNSSASDGELLKELIFRIIH
ncbi:MAG: DNA polymerase III subunit delta [Bacteroidota bacterium]|nr:DNA polymerase III subunit delta [Bacteroidota bacterium]